MGEEEKGRQSWKKVSKRLLASQPTLYSSSNRPKWKSRLAPSSCVTVSCTQGILCTPWSRKKKKKKTVFYLFFFSFVFCRLWSWHFQKSRSHPSANLRRSPISPHGKCCTIQISLFLFFFSKWMPVLLLSATFSIKKGETNKQQKRIE